MKPINVTELPNSLQKKVKKQNGISTKQYLVTKENIRTHSIAVLNVIKDLTQSQRTRVLKQATKMNKI